MCTTILLTQTSYKTTAVAIISLYSAYCLWVPHSRICDKFGCRCIETIHTQQCTVCSGKTQITDDSIQTQLFTIRSLRSAVTFSMMQSQQKSMPQICCTVRLATWPARTNSNMDYSCIQTSSHTWVEGDWNWRQCTRTHPPCTTFYTVSKNNQTATINMT